MCWQQHFGVVCSQNSLVLSGEATAPTRTPGRASDTANRCSYKKEARPQVGVCRLCDTHCTLLCLSGASKCLRICGCRVYSETEQTSECFIFSPVWLVWPLPQKCWVLGAPSQGLPGAQQSCSAGRPHLRPAAQRVPGDARCPVSRPLLGQLDEAPPSKHGVWCCNKVRATFCERKLGAEFKIPLVCCSSLRVPENTHTHTLLLVEYL